jgi:hypothetical protein
MANIRDLGISIIPIAMRPPEIGAGGGLGWMCDTCPDPSGISECNPSGFVNPRHNSFPDTVVAQLKQQLRNQLDN